MIKIIKLINIFLNKRIIYYISLFLKYLYLFIKCDLVMLHQNKLIIDIIFRLYLEIYIYIFSVVTLLS